MPVLINYDQPVFWIPVNAVGTAASVHGERDSRPVVLNFYWTGVGLATRTGSSDEAQLRRGVGDFMKGYAHRDSDEDIMHFQYDGETFRRTVDPKWIPGQ